MFNELRRSSALRSASLAVSDSLSALSSARIFSSFFFACIFVTAWEIVMGLPCDLGVNIGSAFHRLFFGGLDERGGLGLFAFGGGLILPGEMELRTSVSSMR